MMDGKQLALKFLADSCNKVSGVCEKNKGLLDKKKAVRELEKTFALLFVASKEVFEELNIDRDKVFEIMEKILEKREKEY